MLSAPPEGLGADETGSNLVSWHARQHEACQPWVKNEFCLDSDTAGFICADVNNVVGYKKKCPT